MGREPGGFWEEINLSRMDVMKWLKLSWTIGHLHGMEIRIHFSALFSILFVYYVFRPINVERAWLALLLLMGFMLSIFLHELAHASVARIAQAQPKSIVIWFLGGLTTLNHEPEKPLHRAAVYAAGPFLTLVLAGLFFGAYFFMSSSLPSSDVFIYSRLFLALTSLNLILFVFNILPVYPLDGGNILHALMELLFGRSHANLITMIISIPVLLGLVMFGFYTQDYILLVFCVLIALAIGTLNHQTRRWIDLGLNYLFRRGGYYYLQGDYDRAAYYFSRNVEREPDQANHYVRRAVCYINMLKNEEAIADVQHALMIAPDNELALLLRGDLYLIEKDYDSALGWYERAHELNRSSALPYYCRGSLLRIEEQFEAALAELNKAISLSQASHPLSYIERSMIHFRLGNLEAAQEDQDTALQFPEKDALTRAEFNLQMYQGYMDWAEGYYARALAKQPRSWYAYHGRGDAYRANHQFEKAIIDYTKALEINSREPRLYLGRGKSYQAIKEIKCAAADFQTVRSITKNAYLRRQAEELLAILPETRPA